TAGEDVGAYAINQNTLALNGNYTITFTSADLTINKKAVTVTADAKTKVYGDADPALTYIVSPALISGDAFSGALSRTAGEDVGAYAINQNTLALNGNYTITYTSADLTISKKAVTVTADAKAKIYGDADPALTYIVSPALISGDAFSGELSRTAGEDVGTYPITQGSLANGNYAISFVNGVLTIDKAAQQITWNQTLIAGCDGSANIVLTATASSGLSVNYQSADAAIATINGNQLLIAGPGTTMITATQAGNNNYLPAVLVQNELTSKLPAHLVVKRWDDVLVFDNSSKQYTAWQWYKNSGAINGATGQYYYESGKLNGDYYAVVKTAAGTTLQTCPVTITPGSTFIPIAIFPNPVDPGQSITVKTSYTATQLQGATIVVSNIQGVIVQTLQNVMPQTNITMPVVQGFYVIRLKLSDGTTASVNALVKPQ
ncbi:MAG TPA: MBG domain-containing protein, partial [Mucilaginibacter sp.]